MQHRHRDRALYFREQARTTRRHVIPFIERTGPIAGGSRVLEVGCAEAGNLLPFHADGHEVVGIDIDAAAIARARAFYLERGVTERAAFHTSDVYDAAEHLAGAFDLIVMRDAIEHIPDQARFLRFIRPHLRPGGRLFIGFPPWHMPFGGHQQVAHSRLLSNLPYLHLLPRRLYASCLARAGEPAETIEYLMETAETGITLERFSRSARAAGFEILEEQLYLIQPNYETKFGLRPRAQLPLLGKLPGVRNLLTSAGYFVLTA